MNRIKRVALSSAILFSAILLPSCRTVPTSPITMDDAVGMADINKGMINRTAQFRQTVVKNSVRTGVVIDTKTQNFYAHTQQRLAARCKLLGFTDAFIAVNAKSFEEHPDHLRQLLVQLHRAGIKCHASMDLNYLYHYRAGLDLNPLSGTPAEQAIGTVTRFNGVPEESFDGIEAQIMPERISPDDVSGPVAPLFNWGENRFGRGGENDVVIRQTLTLMESVRQHSDNLIVTENVEHDLSDRTCEGQLSKAGINDFLEFCDRLIINPGSSDPDEIIEHASLEVENARKRHSLSIRIVTGDDFYSENYRKLSFGHKPWDTVLAELQRVCRTCRRNPAFAGLVFDNFSGFEILWERNR